MAVTETWRGGGEAVVIPPTGPPGPAAPALVRRRFPLPVESSPLRHPPDAVLGLVLLGVSLGPRRPAAVTLSGDVGERSAGARPEINIMRLINSKYYSIV